MTSTPPKISTDLARAAALGRRPLANQGGFITLDFIFASLLIAGMFTVVFAVCMTLSMVEVAQYLTFSTARVYFAAHDSESQMNSLAQTKYAQLSKQAPFKGLFFADESLFSMPAQPTIGDFNTDYPQSAGADSATFIGARASFRAKVLEFSIPVWGSVTAPASDPGEPDGFTANVSSYLSREPSGSECRAFNEARMQNILQLDQNFQKAAASAGQYQLITDNGC